MPKRGKGQGEPATHERDFAFDRYQAVGQNPYVGLEPSEQADLKTSERQRGGDGRNMGVQGGISSWLYCVTLFARPASPADPVRLAVHHLKLWTEPIHAFSRTAALAT